MCTQHWTLVGWRICRLLKRGHNGTLGKATTFLMLQECHVPDVGADRGSSAQYQRNVGAGNDEGCGLPQML